MFAGIDVSGRWLDLGTSEGRYGRYLQSEEGIRRLSEELLSLAPELIVLEATGGLSGPRRRRLSLLAWASLS